ncbi:MAG TPA: alkaline phosphatase family protein [Candidatus Eisenbacteria bacterium]|jgi:acid phosphatase
MLPTPGTASARPATPAAAWLAALTLCGALLAAPARPAPPAVPALEHVIVVVMENKSAERVLNPTACPFTAKLAGAWTRFSRSYAITHPSQPNYLALWSGSTLEVTSNACPPEGAPFEVENLGHALEAAGRTWRAYSEDLPRPGSPACDSRGRLYTRKHEPWTHFGNLRHENERPYEELAADIAGRRLPDLAFVIPNNCRNTHDCPLQTGDSWLAKELPAMIEAVGHRGLVVLTWDEDDHKAGNNILTVFAGAAVKAGYLSTRPITHYTVLRTLCDGLRITPFGAATAESPITDVWAPAGRPAVE